MKISMSEYLQLLRLDLHAFIMRCFRELNPATPFLDNWHLQIIASKLEEVLRGKCKRLIINIPPRSMKSLCVSIAFSAYYLGRCPSAQILNITYGQELADRFSRDTRTIMRSPWYQRAFATRLARDQQAIGEFATTAKGSRMATSMGGVLTGRGADLIILDDPMKPDEAISDTQRKNVLETFDGVVQSRLNDKRTGAMIIVMQRLHLDDLPGHVLSKGGNDWEVLSLPAIATEAATYKVQTPYGPFEHNRAIGDVLHPEREPLQKLEELRRDMGEYNFAGQYQQSPVPLGGGMIKKSWFRCYKPGEQPREFDRIVMSLDTANKPTELADYSVCTIWGVTRDRRIYLLDVMRRKLNFPDLKRAVLDLRLRYRPDVILVEDKASGTSLLQELKYMNIHEVQCVKVTDDKIMRMHAQTALIENGSVLLPTEASWLAEYIAEITSFPKGKHDDQVDSTSQSLEWIKQPPRRVTIEPLRI